jgi:glycosyltransferase involved in cell wall biosynthesis
MRVAIVHDWLDTWRGGENVLAEVLDLVPHADLFALVDFLDDGHRQRLGGRHARTSFLQRLPLARRNFRRCLPLFPTALERLDLSGYPLVISISHAVAKNVRVTDGQYHLCYCLTPMRYAWDIRDQYLSAIGVAHGPKRWLAEHLLDRLKRWDQAAAARVDRFVAISQYIARRIQAAYGRHADVIYPPVDVEYFQPPPAQASRDYYLTASRFVPYKRVDRIAAAFRALPGRRLLVAGDGPEAARVRAAAGDNVELLGEVPRDRLRTLMQGARAFLFAAEEDFGIVPLEAQACGTPVIALGKGGVAETIQPVGTQPVGVLFDEQSPAAIAQAVERFEAMAGIIGAQSCRANAMRFSAARFRGEFTGLLAAVSENARTAA